MAKQKKPTITEVLKKTITDSGISHYTIERETGVNRASLGRFMRGDQSIRLDVADKLAAYFDLELTKQKR